MSGLEKTRSVLNLGHAGTHLVSFDNFNNDAFETSRMRLLHLDRSTWEDLGSPEEITITIEPDNTLELEHDDNYRSAKTGQFVSEKFAEENPDTTVHES